MREQPIIAATAPLTSQHLSSSEQEKQNFDSFFEDNFSDFSTSTSYDAPKKVENQTLPSPKLPPSQKPIDHKLTSEESAPKIELSILTSKATLQIIQNKIFQGSPSDREEIYQQIGRYSRQDLQDFPDRKNSLFIKKLLNDLDIRFSLEKILGRYTLRTSESNSELNQAIDNFLEILPRANHRNLLNSWTELEKKLEKATQIEALRIKHRTLTEQPATELKEKLKLLRAPSNKQALYDTFLKSSYHQTILGKNSIPTRSENKSKIEEITYPPALTA